MTDIEKEMLEQCGGDTVAYHKILEDIEKEEKEQSKESGERKEEPHSR